jgi:DNA-directed RNA polymerase specialized sigma24 family protein
MQAGWSAKHVAISLLERLRLNSESADWERLVELYRPLGRRWLLRQDVPATDADDLTQDALGVVVCELVNFHHNQRPGAFRAWLRAITVNRLRGYWRGRQQCPQAGGDSEVFLDVFREFSHVCHALASVIVVPLRSQAAPTA